MDWKWLAQPELIWFVSSGITKNRILSMNWQKRQSLHFCLWNSRSTKPLLLHIVNVLVTGLLFIHFQSFYSTLYGVSSSFVLKKKLIWKNNTVKWSLGRFSSPLDLKQILKTNKTLLSPVTDILDKCSSTKAMDWKAWSTWMLITWQSSGWEFSCGFPRSSVPDPVRLCGFPGTALHFILCDMTFAKQTAARKCQYTL